MSELSETEDVANAFDAYLTQAITRECQYIRGGNKMNNKKLPWYDKECRLKRSEAIKAGERVVCERDRCIQYTPCKNYRSCKQRKKREYRARCVENIEKAYMYDKSSMWSVLDKACREISTCNEPQDESFYEYFKELSTPPEANYFNPEYEACAL